MKNLLQNMHKKTMLVLVVLAAVFIGGYWLVGWRNRAINNYQNNIPYPPLVDGVQVIKMHIDAGGFSPSYFRVRSGIQVAWEITSSAEAPCSGESVVAPDLTYGSPTQVNPNTQITTIEFLAPMPGLYKFHCLTEGGKIEGAIESNS